MLGSRWCRRHPVQPIPIGLNASPARPAAHNRWERRGPIAPTAPSNPCLLGRAQPPPHQPPTTAWNCKDPSRQPPRSTHSYRGWTQPLPDTTSTTAWNCKGSSHQAPRSTHSDHVERNPRPTNHSKGLKFQGGRGHFNLVQPHRNGVGWQPVRVENRETVGKLLIFNQFQPGRPGGYNTICRVGVGQPSTLGCLAG